MGDLRDKVVAITGHSAGVGRSAARRVQEPLGLMDLRGSDRAPHPRVPVGATEHVGWCRRAAAAGVITVAAAVGGALALLCQGRCRGEWGELGKPREGHWR